MSRNKSITASYVIVQEGTKILLSKRLNTGYMDGHYQLPSGHTEPGETPSEAAVRELREETGLEATPENLVCVMTAYRRLTEGDRVDFFFRAESWNGQPANPEPRKCGGWEWWDANKLPSETIPYLRELLEAIALGQHYAELEH